MAWIRRLPPRADGTQLWAATVLLPTGRRVTKSHERRTWVADWAADLEADIRRGDWIDPRAGRITVGELWDRYGEDRRLELASRRRDESHWRCHVAPYWARTPIGGILTPDVTAWVTKMEKAKVGAPTIEGSVGVLRALLKIAVDARLVRFNSAAGVAVPRRDAHLDRILEPDEMQSLLEALDRTSPGRPDARLFCELLRYCGLRWEEAAAVDRDHVVMRKGLLLIGPVVERDGTIRPYPKTPAGEREVPVDDDLWPRLRAHVLTIEPGELIFTTRAGRPLDYSNWHRDVWTPALRGRPERRRVRGHAHRPAIAGAELDDPQPTPHDLRHGYGTELAEAGVPVHEIMVLMGHESLASAQRYLHAGKDRHDRARQAIQRGRRRPNVEDESERLGRSAR
jgi:integrase